LGLGCWPVERSASTGRRLAAADDDGIENAPADAPAHLAQATGDLEVLLISRLP
jgi:hypothetical protein